MRYPVQADQSDPGLSESSTHKHQPDEQPVNDLLENDIACLGDSFAQSSLGFDLDPTQDPISSAWSFNWEPEVRDGLFDLDNFDSPTQDAPPVEEVYDSKHRRDFSDATTMSVPLVSPGYNDISPISPVSRAMHTPVRGAKKENSGPPFMNPPANSSFLDSPSSIQIIGSESPLQSPTNFQSPYSNQSTSMHEVYTPMQARRLMSAGSPHTVRKSTPSISEEYMLEFDSSFDPSYGPNPPTTPKTMANNGQQNLNYQNVSLQTQNLHLQTPNLPTPNLQSSSLQNTNLPLTTLPEQSALPEQASPQRKEKKKEVKRDGRKRIAKEQSDLLESFYQKNPRPERDDRLRLASATGLEQRTVQVWFQNRRAKTRAMEAARETDSTRVRNAAAAAAAIAASTGFSCPAPNSRMQMPPHQQTPNKRTAMQPMSAQQHNQQMPPQMPSQMLGNAPMYGYPPYNYNPSHSPPPPPPVPAPPTPQQLKQDARAYGNYQRFPPVYSPRAPSSSKGSTSYSHQPRPPPLLRSQSLPTVEPSIRFNKDLEMFQDRMPAKRADSIVSVNSMGPGLPVSPINSVEGGYHFSPEIVTDTEGSPASASPVSWDHNPWGRSQSSSSLSLAAEWSQSIIAPDVKRRRSMASGSYNSPRNDEYALHRVPTNPEPDYTGSLAVSAAHAALMGRHRSNTQPIIRHRQPSIRLQLDESSPSAHLIVVPELDSKVSSHPDYFDHPDMSGRAGVRVMANRPRPQSFGKTTDNLL